MFAVSIALLMLIQSVPDSGYSIKKDQSVVLHDSLLSASGELLNFSAINAWEYTAQNPFNEDNNVQWIKLNKPLSQENALLDSLWNGVGWFRLTFSLDSSFSLRKGFLDFYDFRNLAVKVWLNNESVLQIGEPGHTVEEEIMASSYQSVGAPLFLDANTEYVLLIQRSYQRYNLLGWEPYKLRLRLESPELTKESLEWRKYVQNSDTFNATLLLVLIFLQILMLVKVKGQHGAIWLIILLSFYAFDSISGSLSQSITYSYWPANIIFILSNLQENIIPVIIPVTVFRLLDLPTPAFWRWFAYIGLVMAPITVFTEFSYELYAYLSFFMLALIGGFYAVTRAYKKGKKDILLIAFSILGFPLFFLLSIGSIQIIGRGQLTLFNQILFLTAQLALPIGLFIYQGRKFLRLHTQMDDLVEEQTAALQKAYRDLKQSLSDLKSAQEQLVQQEKLASLGQLTAGIAHEIKNPLNFVNNFSDLSVDLIEEARQELKNEHGNGNNVKDTLAILDDVEANLRKIHEHGSRADGIVKSMLEHSRGGSGEMEATRLNPLIKEYVNLAYHGMRAGKHPIKVDIDMQLDESIGEVNLIAEDFSRVIVNLCNNAFDAMREKILDENSESTDSYKPQLTVRTRNKGNEVAIYIEDNGPGIPEEMKDKIMQPFFTTKKGTLGTGLGLSITNDIIKAHGGSLDIESEPGKTVFTILLNT